MAGKPLVWLKMHVASVHKLPEMPFGLHLGLCMQKPVKVHWVQPGQGLLHLFSSRAFCMICVCVRTLQECTVPEGLVALPQNCSSLIGKLLNKTTVKTAAMQRVLPKCLRMCLLTAC